MARRTLKKVEIYSRKQELN